VLLGEWLALFLMKPHPSAVDGKLSGVFFLWRGKQPHLETNEDPDLSEVPLLLVDTKDAVAFCGELAI